MKFHADRCMVKILLMMTLAGAWVGCTGTDSKHDDEGWVKHTASPGEQEARRQREERKRAEVEAGREKEETLLAARQARRYAEKETYGDMLEEDPFMFEKRLDLDGQQKEPVLDIINQSMMEKRAVYQKYGGEIDLRMKEEIDQIHTQTVEKLSEYLTDMQLNLYSMVIDEMRSSFYQRMQVVDEEQNEERVERRPPEAVIWHSFPRRWWRRGRR